MNELQLNPEPSRESELLLAIAHNTLIIATVLDRFLPFLQVLNSIAHPSLSVTQTPASPPVSAPSPATKTPPDPTTPAP